MFKSFKDVHLPNKIFCHQNQLSLNTSGNIIENFSITTATHIAKTELSKSSNTEKEDYFPAVLFPFD